MIKANVTECHLCQRCPRLLAYHLHGKSAAWTVGLKGGTHFPGKDFHNHIAKTFYQALASKKTNRLKSELIDLLSKKPKCLASAIHGLLQEHVLNPLLTQKMDKMKYEAVISLGRGVELWANHIANFLDGQDIKKPKRLKELIAQIFCNPETLMTAKTQLPDGREFQLGGQFDSLLVDQTRGEVVLIEFKGLKPRFHDEELVQIGLYGWLIRQTTGVQPRGVVLYLDEDEPEVVYSAEELERMSVNLFDLFTLVADIKEKPTLKKTLPPPSHPFLCRECFLSLDCDQDWGPREAAETDVEKSVSVEPTLSETSEDSEEARQLLEKLVDVLNVLKLPVEPQGFIIGPRLIRLKIRPVIERGTTVKKIMNRATDLQVALSLDSPPLIQARAGYIGLDAPRRTSTPLTLVELMKIGENEQPDSVVAFPLGMGVDGSVLWADLAEPTMTSILVAGTSGSGKSIFLRSLVVALAMNVSPDNVQFTLIDPKRVTFTDLNELPHLRKLDLETNFLSSPIIMDLEEAFAALETLVLEMEDRYKEFTEHQVPDIKGYHKLGHRLPHQVVVIDEYADLMTDKQYKAQAETCIQRLCQKGRAAGCHIVLSTQRPDAKVVTPLIKANLQLKVALKVTTAANSNIILDEPGAERLIGKGDMLIGGALPVTRLQGALPTKTEIEKAFDVNQF